MYGKHLPGKFDQPGAGMALTEGTVSYVRPTGLSVINRWGPSQARPTKRALMTRGLGRTGKRAWLELAFQLAFRPFAALLVSCKCLQYGSVESSIGPRKGRDQIEQGGRLVLDTKRISKVPRCWPPWSYTATFSRSCHQGIIRIINRSDEAHYATRICLAGPAHGPGRGHLPGHRVHGHQLSVRW